MITLHPVLEVTASEGFALWPIAEVQSYGFMALGGELSPAEVGTAVMRIARSTTAPALELNDTETWSD